MLIFYQGTAYLHRCGLIWLDEATMIPSAEFFAAVHSGTVTALIWQHHARTWQAFTA